jgi:hypothetical protein
MLALLLTTLLLRADRGCYIASRPVFLISEDLMGKPISTKVLFDSFIRSETAADAREELIEKCTSLGHYKVSDDQVTRVIEYNLFLISNSKSAYVRSPALRERDNYRFCKQLVKAESTCEIM